jgi:hypothetical protein
MARTYLGVDANLGGVRRVFEIEGALEVDENNFTQIERTRVYFDDVLGITYHQQTGVAFLLFTGVMAVFLGAIAIIVAVDGTPEGAIVLGICASPFALAFFLRVLLKVDVITVYGRRTRAIVRFGFRKSRARMIYNDLTAKIRARQAKALAEQPPPPPPPAAPDLPLPPPPAA